jgi:mono/diheme cytochrome c family protein
MRRILGIVVAVLVLGFVAIQLVPYGRSHSNPPVTGTPPWDSAQTQALFMRACGDCHSNETAWPWYTNVAPISWRIQNHVDEGRATLNVSEWGTGRQKADEAGEKVAEGEMPPADYLLLHPEARLSDVEKQALIDGMNATFGR